MSIKNLAFVQPKSYHVPALRSLFSEAFGDGDEFLSAFFSRAFSCDRAACAFIGEELAAALYWLDCSFKDRKIAYIYAVAAGKNFRGQGIGSYLLTESHKLLKSMGYAGAILVPVSPELYPFYARFGYESCTEIGEFRATAGGAAAPLSEISAAEYAARRRELLPEGAVIQEGAFLDLLATYTQFLAGEDFILAASRDGDRLISPEFIGNRSRAAGILAALGAECGVFRTPITSDLAISNGSTASRPFTMYKSLDGSMARPTYFAFALD